MRTVTLTPAALADSRSRRRRRRRLIVAALGLALAALAAAALMIGETFYSPGEVLGVLLGRQVPGASFTVGELRLPRTVLAVLVGAAFGAAGTTFQTLLGNQLASPDIIGVSAGAAAAGVVGITVFRMSQWEVSAFALAASLLVSAAIYLLSVRGRFAGTRLILVGIGTAAILQSVTTWTLSTASSWDLPAATRWLTGSLNGASWERVVPVAVTVAVVVPSMVALNNLAAVMRLGDESATVLGVRVTPVRLAAIAGATVLVAVATATCGPIAFVAFLAGPIAARLVGPAAPLTAPAALTGALLVLGADLIGQFALHVHYPVGVVTGVVGAPYLLYLIIRSNREGRTP